MKPRLLHIIAYHAADGRKTSVLSDKGIKTAFLESGGQQRRSSRAHGHAGMNLCGLARAATPAGYSMDCAASFII
jgi:hypothetical protein